MLFPPRPARLAPGRCMHRHSSPRAGSAWVSAAWFRFSPKRPGPDRLHPGGRRCFSTGCRVLRTRVSATDVFLFDRHTRVGVHRGFPRSRPEGLASGTLRSLQGGLSPRARSPHPAGCPRAGSCAFPAGVLVRQGEAPRGTVGLITGACGQVRLCSRLVFLGPSRPVEGLASSRARPGTPAPRDPNPGLRPPPPSPVLTQA